MRAPAIALAVLALLALAGCADKARKPDLPTGVIVKPVPVPVTLTVLLVS